MNLEVNTQEELDMVLNAGDVAFVRKGNFIVKKGFVYATEHVIINAYGNASIYAYGNSFILAHEHTVVTAHNETNVYAFDDSTVNAYGECIVTAADNVAVFAYDDVQVTTFNDATTYLFQNATLVQHKNKDKMDVSHRLCVHDPRNPDCTDDDKETIWEYDDRCYCDNCFYGRTELALEIIKLQELI